MITTEFKEQTCEHCGQTLGYILALDHGTADIVKCFARAVKLKGINIIHPKQEMEVPHEEWSYAYGTLHGKLTSTQIGNLTRARVHGLLARVKDEPGNWCLTTKGANFLKGMPVPRYAIVKKTTEDERSHKEEYYEEETETVTVYDLTNEKCYWQGIDFEILNGRIITDVQEKEPALTLF